jgi:hypothetical protein
MPPAWVQNSVAVGTAERGLSPSRMSFLGIVQPTPGGAKHMHLMICTLTMPFPFRPFLVRCAVPNPVLGLGGGTPPLPPVWQGSNTPAARHLSLPVLQSCIPIETCHPPPILPRPSPAGGRSLSSIPPCGPTPGCQWPCHGLRHTGISIGSVLPVLAA